MGDSLPGNIYGRESLPDKRSMVDSSPDKLYGREFARYIIWASVCQIQYMAARFRQIKSMYYIWARVRQIPLYMGDTSPDKIYGREFDS